MGIQTQSALVASILLLTLAINAAFLQRRVKNRAAFTALVIAFLAYDLAFFLYSVVGGTFWSHALLFSGIAVAQTTLRFFRRFLDRPMDAVQTVVTVVSVLAVVVSATRLAQGPMLGGLVAALAIGSYGYCVWLLWLRRQATRGTPESRRMVYLVVGGALSVSFGAVDLLALVGITVPALGHLLTTLYLYLLMQVVQRSRLLDLQELVGRGLVLIVQATLVAIVYALLLVWVGDRLGLFFFNTLLASVALVLAYEPLQRAIDTLLGRSLFGAKYEFQAHLAQLRRELANVINLGDLVEKVLGQLSETRRVTHASLFLLEDEGHAFFCAGAEGPCAIERVSVVKARAFLDALRADSVLAIDDVEQEILERSNEVGTPAVARLEMMRDLMVDMSAGLTFALRSGERLLGWLNVRDERLREPYSSDEIAQLVAVTVQIAAVVENSELFERLKERDRLTVIGEMATGMAHEIRNPLGAIKAAAQLLDPAKLVGEDQEWVDVILEETDRLNHVLSQFLDYARPFKGAHAPVDLEKVIQRVATLIRTEERTPPVAVAVVAHPLPTVLGDANALHQVILNLARNACDAMTEGGTLRLTARLSPGNSERVEVLVADEGQGIPAEVRSMLFIPFFTTKSGGTGLGLPISQRIVRHHGSTIRVESTVGQGTVMRFSLPVEVQDDKLTGEHRPDGHRLMGTLRIVGGRFRGRKLRVPDHDGVRPTTDRVRESLFNILDHRFGRPCHGARVLDLFAGSGALGCEASSRGAVAVTLVEKGAKTSAITAQNAKHFPGVAAVRSGAIEFLGGAPTAFDLVFLDPPYGAALYAPTLAKLAQGGWLADDALVCVEHAADAPLNPPAGWLVELQRRFGGTAILVLKRRPP